VEENEKEIHEQMEENKKQGIEIDQEDVEIIKIANQTDAKDMTALQK